MTSFWLDWTNLLLRWAHLIAGIAWIGSSFYFMWLDSSLEKPATARKGVEGELWMVHSGGFYQVEKRLVGPGEVPQTLHWFKWEATFTWLTGFLLLVVVYYLTGGAYLLDPSKPGLTPALASGIGIASLAAAWFAYDLLWQSRLGREVPLAATALSLGGLAGITLGFHHVFSGRGTFIHVGALLGTLMVTNVWVRILPAQQKMIDATREGRVPDFELGKGAKRRSVHNSYVTFPVLFIMLSNHYPSTYAHPWSPLILGLLIVLGCGVRHVMVAGLRGWPGLAAAGGALASLLALTLPATGSVNAGGTLAPSPGAPRVAFRDAHAVIHHRCTVCHSSNPVDRSFGPSPGGASFETPASIQALAARIRNRAIETRTMPLANKSGMTDEERALLANWLDQGARLE